jgi:hypothetical protein
LRETGVWIGATGASKPIFTKVGEEYFPLFSSRASNEGEVVVEGELRNRIRIWITKQEKILRLNEERGGET